MLTRQTKTSNQRQSQAICFFGMIAFGLLSPFTTSAAETSPFTLGTSSTSLLAGATLNLTVEKGVKAQTSHIGDTFVARLQEPVYSSDGKNLLIPSGSWITGRVTEVKPPGFLSKAARLKLELDFLTSMKGDLYPLNATLSFEEGKITQEGVLDPQTGFKDKALAPTRKLLDSDTGQIVSIVTLGIPVVGTLVGGSVIAVVSKGDDIGLANGERFKIVLKDDSLLIKP
ncbi:MAG: hypothetical protein SFT81_01185 [Candidatus Caenarcaniphilales bacterium]|nr:hypothetical protein [Candidatus Caenarcaniphilales bacterium]